MTLTVLDEDVTASDKVGSCQIKLSSLCVNGGLDEWFSIQHKGKTAGQVHLKGTWKPSTQAAKGAQPQVNMGQNAAMGMFGVQPMGMAQPMGMGMQQPMMQQPMMQQPMMQQPMMQQPMMQQPMMQQPMQQPMMQ